MQLISGSLIELIALAVIVFTAGVVRGAIGFGFSALVVAAGALFLSPALLVPMVVLLEIAASIQMLPSALSSVHWRAHNRILLALLIATPIGVYALAIAPDDLLRAVVALFILILASVMLSGFRFKGELGSKHLFGVGLIAGLCNGVAGIGGMPIAVYLNSTSISLAQARATMVMVFVGIETLFIICALFADVYNLSIVYTALFSMIPMILGVAVGSAIFDRVDEAMLRRCAVLGLFALALAGLVRVIWSWFF